MLPGLNILTRDHPLCLSLPHTNYSATVKTWHERQQPPWGLFNNTFSFTVSLPYYLHFPLAVHCHISCYPSCVPISVLVPISPPCLSSPLSPSSLSVQSPGQLIAPHHTWGCAQFPSSSSLSIISSELRGLTTRMSPVLCCGELGS